MFTIRCDCSIIASTTCNGALPENFRVVLKNIQNLFSYCHGVIYDSADANLRTFSNFLKKRKTVRPARATARKTVSKHITRTATTAATLHA